MFLNKIVILLSLFYSVKSWYVCDDLDFCKPIRNQDGKDRFYIDQNSVKISESNLEADLVNKEGNNEVLKLSFTSLEHETFRLNINDPNKPRHVMSDALDGEPKTANFDSTTCCDGGLIIINAGPNVVEITLDPFKLIIKRDSETIISVNEKSKMIFNFADSNGNEAVALDIWMAGVRAYGLPEHAESLALKTTGPGGLDPYRFYNVDYGYYKIDSREALYGTVPVLYAHGLDKSAGVFWLNSAQTFVDVNTDNDISTYFISETGAIDLFFLTGPTLEDSIKQYAKLTGTAPLPQLFAIGFHQSRYNYDNQSDLLGVVDGFDKNDFPLDVVWLDIDYTDGKKYFTWDLKNFAEPLEMQNIINTSGRKLVVIIDPHIKVENGYSVYDQALQNGYFVMNADGSVFEGNCWPGLSSYIDFSNPNARSWYSGLYSLVNFPNTTLNTYIWNDMNEPSVFEMDENSMPLDVKLFDNWSLRDLRNTYGFYQTMGTYAGLLARSNNQLRPFILTRSHFAGSQRYTAMWTGDNVAEWNYLKISVPMCLTEALAGISFCGADVGGFINDVEDELFQRWYQAGAWLPFYRSHATKETKRREPYLYPADIQVRLRNALNQRYAHLPYWYTLWWEHSNTGTPVIRPLTYHYLEEATLDIDNEWLVGSDILVSPVMEKGISTIDVYLPGTSEKWHLVDGGDYTTYNGGESITLPVDLDTVPVFYRSGSIIPRKDTTRPSTTHTHDDDYSLYVMLNDNGEAKGNLYIDDFESFNYKEKQYLYQRYEYKNSALEMTKIDEDADFNTEASVGSIHIFGQNKNKSNASLIIDGIETKLDTFYKDSCLTLSNLHIKLNKPFKLSLS